MEIRSFCEDDADVVSAIICANLCASTDYGEEVIAKFCAKYSPSALIAKSVIAHMVVVVEDSEIIGTGLLEGNYINMMNVAIDHQGKGIGTALLNYFKDIAKQNGETWVKLHATPSSLAFYEKNGFVVDHKVEGKTNGLTYFTTTSLL